jgi:hypothetical protein
MTIAFNPWHLRIGQATMTVPSYVSQASTPRGPGATVGGYGSINASCQSDFKMVEVGVESYKAETGIWPSNVSILESRARLADGDLITSLIRPLQPNGYYTITVSGPNVTVMSDGIARTSRSASVACVQVTD